MVNEPKEVDYNTMTDRELLIGLHRKMDVLYGFTIAPKITRALEMAPPPPTVTNDIKGSETAEAILKRARDQRILDQQKSDQN